MGERRFAPPDRGLERSRPSSDYRGCSAASIRFSRTPPEGPHPLEKPPPTSSSLRLFRIPRRVGARLGGVDLDATRCVASTAGECPTPTRPGRFAVTPRQWLRSVPFSMSVPTDVGEGLPFGWRGAAQRINNGEPRSYRRRARFGCSRPCRRRAGGLADDSRSLRPVRVQLASARARCDRVRHAG